MTSRLQRLQYQVQAPIFDAFYGASKKRATQRNQISLHDLMKRVPRTEIEIQQPQQIIANTYATITKLMQCDSKNEQCQAPQTVLELCKQIRSNTQEDQVLKLLGIIAYFADNSSNQLLSMIDPNSYDQTIQKLEERFNSDMLQERKALDNRCLFEAQTGMFQYDLVRGFHLPKVMAQVLITSSGFLNIGLGDYLQTVLFDKTKTLHYQETIAHAIQLLKEQTSLQNRLLQIQAPATPGYRSETIIRATLNLDPAVPVNNVHAKIVGLAAFFSKLHQGPIGSCFATNVGMEVQIQRPDKFLDDIAALLQNDKLVRTVDGKPRDIAYVLDATNDALTTAFEVDTEGNIASEVNICSSHSFVNACIQMGISEESSTSAIQQALATLAGTKSTLKTTPLKIIETIARQHFRQDIMTKIDLGKVGFCAIDNSLVLRAWEELIAAMAEMRKHSYVRSQILKSVAGTLESVLKPTSTAEKRVNALFRNTFINTMNEKLDLRYDPSTSVDETSKVSSDGKSNFDAAFVLFNEAGKEVLTPDDFRNVILEDIEIAGKSCATRVASDEKPLLQRTINKVIEYVKTNAFLQQEIQNFDPDNRKLRDPLANWEQLAGIPWRAQYGDDPMEVLDIYFNQSTPLEPLQFTPQNAQDLMMIVISIAKQLQQKLHYLDQPIDETFAMESPQHAFEFIPEHPTMAAIVKDPRDARTFVTEYVQKQGRISMPLTEDLRQAIITQAANCFKTNAEKERFYSKVEKINVYDTVNAFIEVILDIIKYLLPTALTEHKRNAEYLIRRTVLEHAVRTKSVEALKPFIVHFADTNWNDGDHNIHFCFFPHEGRVYFGTVYDDGTNLQMMDQDEWVNNQQWSILTRSLISL